MSSKDYGLIVISGDDPQDRSDDFVGSARDNGIYVKGAPLNVGDFVRQTDGAGNDIGDISEVKSVSQDEYCARRGEYYIGFD